MSIIKTLNRLMPVDDFPRASLNYNSSRYDSKGIIDTRVFNYHSLDEDRIPKYIKAKGIIIPNHSKKNIEIEFKDMDHQYSPYWIKQSCYGYESIDIQCHDTIMDALFEDDELFEPIQSVVKFGDSLYQKKFSMTPFHHIKANDKTIFHYGGHYDASLSIDTINPILVSAHGLIDELGRFNTGITYKHIKNESLYHDIINGASIIQFNKDTINYEFESMSIEQKGNMVSITYSNTNNERIINDN
jgi:hypothetical protein